MALITLTFCRVENLPFNAGAIWDVGPCAGSVRGGLCIRRFTSRPTAKNRPQVAIAAFTVGKGFSPAVLVGQDNSALLSEISNPQRLAGIRHEVTSMQLREIAGFVAIFNVANYSAETSNESLLDEVTMLCRTILRDASR